MYIGLKEGWQEFSSSVCELAAGELLLYREEDGVYFSTKNVYCNYAGYASDWKNFIGYQNVIFYKEIKRLKHIASYDYIKEIEYKGEELQEFLARSKAFDLDYVYFEDVKYMECINKLIEQARPFYEEIEKAALKEHFAAFLKGKLEDKLPVFYADLLLLKALMQPRFVDNNDFFLFSNRKKLNSENILAIWRANVID